MELNAEKIIKALEWCTSGGNCMECAEDKNTPNVSQMGCMAIQMRKALALITSQEQRIKELTTENERLKSVEFTCGFIKPHKVLECPIFDEVERAKADIVEKVKIFFAMRFGTYTDKDMTPITEVFYMLDQIAKEMLEGDAK